MNKPKPKPTAEFCTDRLEERILREKSRAHIVHQESPRDVKNLEELGNGSHTQHTHSRSEADPGFPREDQA